MAQQFDNTGDTFTSEQLVAEVRRAVSFPDASDWTVPDLLALADRAIRTVITREIVTNLGMTGRWLDFADVLAEDFLNGSDVLMGGSAAADTISHVEWFDTLAADPIVLEPCSPVEAREFIASPRRRGRPSHFYFRGSRIVLVPTPSNTGGKVRVWYAVAHPKLVEDEGNVDTISDAEPGAIVLTGGSAPANWPASGSFYVDLYSAHTPHDPLIRRLNVAGSSPYIYLLAEGQSADDMTVLESAPAGSFYAALAGTSNCVQLPRSFRPALVARTASLLLRSQGDSQGANDQWGIADQELAAISPQITPRSKGRSQTFVNHSSPLRTRGGRRGHRGGWR